MLSVADSKLSIVLLGVVVFLLGGCTEPAPELEIVDRLIVSDPEVLLDTDDLFERKMVFDWRFKSESDVEPWTVAGVTGSRLEQRNWTLVPAAGEVQLERGCAAECAEFHAIEIVVSGLGKGEATLQWAAEGQSFVESRSSEGQSSRPRREGPGLTTLVFDLLNNRSWTGSANRVRLVLESPAEGDLKLFSVRGIRRSASVERLAEITSQAWKIDFGADVRNARLAVPGVPLEWRVENSLSQQWLQVSYGLEASMNEPIHFRIEAVAENGGQSTVLLDEKLDPDGRGGQWVEATLDLEPWIDQNVLLRFETRGPDRPLDLVRGFPVWGNPEILAPREQGRQRRPNIILISLDTLRSDRLSAYGHDRETSPNLDRWAANSAVLFENAVVQGPWTLPSHASMFTGLEALRHDVNHYKEAPASLEMLAEMLRNEGYTTAAITGGGYLRPQFGFAQGFDSFRYWPEILAENELAEGMDKLLSWLTNNRSRPFFLLFHTYETHYPHRRRQPYFDRFQGQQPLGDIRGEIEMRARTQEPEKPYWQHDYFAVKVGSTGEEVEGLNESEKAYIRTQYDSAVAYVDAQLGYIFDQLKRSGLEGETLIVLTSDHGEALGESGRAGHNYLNDYNVMVPLVIEFPDQLAAGARIEQQVRSIDIVPTILEVIGIQPPQRLDGVSLLPLIGGDHTAVPPEAWTYASSSNFGIGLRYRNQLKYVFNNTAWSGFLGQEELYDLHVDPGERDDIAAEHPSIDELREATAAAFEKSHQGLRLRIRNSSSGRLSGRLLYGWSGHNRVKAIDRDGCDCVRWDGERSGQFALDPNSEVTLLFESIPGHQVGLQGRFERKGEAAARFNERFDVREIEASGGLDYSAEGWRRVSPEAAGEVSFSIWKEGPGEAELLSAPSDSKLSAQLRALGYVE